MSLLYREYRSFAEARAFVRTLKLKNNTEWNQYSQGKLEGHAPKPEDIPANPRRTYKDQGWQSWGDWLGTGAIVPRNRAFRSFEKARAFVRTLKLKNNTEWNQYSQGKLEGHAPKPEDIPANPQRTYKDQGWQNLGDWLGTGTIAPQNRVYRPFEEARAFVRTLKLKNHREWFQYSQGKLAGHAPKPEDIPAAPNNTYKNQGWQGWGDWLGTGTIANFNRVYRSFKEARAFVHTLKLKNREEWRLYSQGKLEGHAPKPEDIPAAPWGTYKDQGWQSMGDWLGTEKS